MNLSHIDFLNVNILFVELTKSGYAYPKVLYGINKLEHNINIARICIIMGASQSIQKINFQDMQTVVKTPETYLLINTLPVFEQDCLITSTVPGSREEEIINQLIKTNKNAKIIVYGRNANDDSIYKKYTQLTNLGFYNVFVYTGGLFEWLLLQDIYSAELFGTTNVAKDLLKYKPPPKLNISLLEYS